MYIIFIYVENLTVHLKNIIFSYFIERKHFSVVILYITLLNSISRNSSNFL